MSFAAIAIGSLLLGQAVGQPPEAAPAEHSLLRSVSPSSESPALAAPPAANSPGQAAAPARPRPAAMVAQSLDLPADSVLTGRPIRLLALLRRPGSATATRIDPCVLAARRGGGQLLLLPARNSSRRESSHWWRGRGRPPRTATRSPRRWKRPRPRPSPHSTIWPG